MSFAIIRATGEGPVLEEIAEDVTVEEVVNATQAPLHVRSSIMPLWMPLVSSDESW
jgi:acyl CoA:acetate/3-ketoacid CoA transferase beta subunit